eukprot:gnl/Chilomastix_cuspidata/2217.p1 GENE.gnl/Chilomastix_cuspidata/2217~~gnl/Chilomastix_cuspidata/2217.p1  ORF type:complete len:184 (+),score=40.79 gnl/Chilomastix_cuspidata/2217:16-567(+)
MFGLGKVSKEPEDNKEKKSGAALFVSQMAAISMGTAVTAGIGAALGVGLSAWRSRSSCSPPFSSIVGGNVKHYAARMSAEHFVTNTSFLIVNTVTSSEGALNAIASRTLSAVVLEQIPAAKTNQGALFRAVSATTAETAFQMLFGSSVLNTRLPDGPNDAWGAVRAKTEDLKGRLFPTKQTKV